MSELGIFFKIVMPLNVPVISTVIVLYFVGTYNDLYGPALYIHKIQLGDGQQHLIFENLYRTVRELHRPLELCRRCQFDRAGSEVLLFAFMQKKFMQSVAGTGIKS